MSADQIERLFQDFTQVDASTTRRYGGTGLGLAISRRFCEMMGGHIAVESALQQGSTFSFQIPSRLEVATADAARPAAERSAPERAAAPSGDTVLVIDDDPLVHDLMARYLAREGFRVVTATSGEEGLELACRLRPAAITLDVVMPGLDGWAVLAALKGHPDLRDIPVVMVTMTDDRRMGYALGAADYLTKPLDPVRLTAVLRRHTGIGAAATVLLVDDDAAMREMTRRLLQRERWQVIEADGGRAALQRLRERVPTVIVLDLMMPEMDGFDLIVALRGDPLWRSIPVVVLTAKEVSAADRLRLNGSVARILRKAAFRRDELLLEVREQVKASLQPHHPVL